MPDVTQVSAEIKNFQLVLKRNRKSLTLRASQCTPKNLRRRAALLEAAATVTKLAIQWMARRAMKGLSCGDLELLICAFGAEREGRPLTEPQGSARELHDEIVEGLCESFGLLDAKRRLGIELDISLIDDARLNYLILRLPWRVILLAIGVDGCHESTELKEAQTEFLQEVDRLSGLAGFRCAEDFEQALMQWKELKESEKALQLSALESGRKEPVVPAKSLKKEPPVCHQILLKRDPPQLAVGVRDRAAIQEGAHWVAGTKRHWFSKHCWMVRLRSW